MQVWMTLLLTVQMLAAIVMIGLVLVQQGKGADMGASFGGGASGSLFGATGSANFLSRSTAVCATVFFVATLGLAFLSNVPAAAGRSDDAATLLDRPEAAASVPEQAQIPGAVPAATATPADIPLPAAISASGAGMSTASSAAR